MHYQTPPVYHTDIANTKLMCYAVGALSLTAIGLSCYTLYTLAHYKKINEIVIKRQNSMKNLEQSVNCYKTLIEPWLLQSVAPAIQNLQKDMNSLDKKLEKQNKTIQDMNDETLFPLVNIAYSHYNDIKTLRYRVNALSTIVKTFCMPGAVVSTGRSYMPAGPYPELANHPHTHHVEERYNVHDFDE
jgi:hypothetical protein